MSDRIETDIFISGGGVAGLTAAIAFGHAGREVVSTDPHPPITDGKAAGADLRTTALLQPSRRFLERIGLWERLDAHATPLQIMRIVDAGGPEPEARASHDFNASDISDEPFGWNVPNWLLRREMVAHLADMPNVSFLSGVGTSAVMTRSSEARIKLSDGRRVTARLVIGADGRSSPVRAAAGIGARTMRYGQRALAFAVTHPIPHDNVSTEIHRTGGPFTLVPLPDFTREDGTQVPCSAVVWMEPGAEAARLAALPEPEFNAEMSVRSAHLFGPLTLVSRRTVWPIISQVADRMSSERIALVAEAAHVMPPIGAQGLNMSLKDIATLLDLVEAHPDDPGDPQLLDRYHRARHTDVAARISGIDMLNRASMAQAPIARDLRLRALNALYSVAPVRRTLMQVGLGATGSTAS